MREYALKMGPIDFNQHEGAIEVEAKECGVKIDISITTENDQGCCLKLLDAIIDLIKADKAIRPGFGQDHNTGGKQL